MNALRSDKFRRALKLPDFLPGSKLERMNNMHTTEVVKVADLNKQLRSIKKAAK